MQWRSCPAEPMAWISLRELVLSLLHTPALILPLVGVCAAVLSWRLQWSRPAGAVLALLLPLLVSTIYSPVATALLSAWLQSQLPVMAGVDTSDAVVVLVGRGPLIASATTAAAAQRLQSGKPVAAYMSGDGPSTGQLLVQRGFASALVAGDSCARTTWENASITAAWLRQYHPGAPVLLITDPWQLPRATLAFQRQGLRVTPQAAVPALPPEQRNRLALRESLAIAWYRLQGRI